MSAGRTTARGDGTGKDTRGAGQARAGGVHPGTRGPQLTDTELGQIRAGGLQLPRAPHPGRRWVPRTPAEEHLLREAQRLERYRLGMLGELGTVRATASTKAARRERLDAACRTAGRSAGCPLSEVELRALVAAAAGESALDASRRTLVPLSAVKDRRQSAVLRLGARSLVHAVALCVAAGWITPLQITEGVAP